MFTQETINIRKLPYPYKAMLAICSDLDGTPNSSVYMEIMRFLNTTKDTMIGRGVGLEIGNSIYFDMPPGQFAYWNTDDASREMICDLIKSGHIDCLHSYGDLATSRSHAGRALNELSRHNCQLEVWVDHSVSPSNFDGGIMQGTGDIPESKAYHADLTCDFGIKYIWKGRVTSIIGQNTKKKYGGIWNHSHPFSSSKTILKEAMKGCFAYWGSKKYAMHAQNQIIKSSTLRDGHKVLEFMRVNPYWGGVGLNATYTGLGEILTNSMLDLLIQKQGFCILYTHLGKIIDKKEPFPTKTRNALALLAQYARNRDILVTTTQRLLNYCSGIKGISISSFQKDNIQYIDISSRSSAQNLRGMTLYTTSPENTRLIINGKSVINSTVNDYDNTGRKSISLRWDPLIYPY